MCVMTEKRRIATGGVVRTGSQQGAAAVLPAAGKTPSIPSVTGHSVESKRVWLHCRQLDGLKP